MVIGAAVAQTDPGEHGAHHPEQPAPAKTLPQAGPSGGAIPAPPMAGTTPGAQTGAGCGGMMGCMGGGPRPFYATLLDMPALTPEARRFIEAEAERRIGWGSQAIAAGQMQLNHALAANDLAAVQQATVGVREGVLQLESGTAALRAIAAETPPRQFALAWFRGQLGLPAAEAAPMAMDSGPWGLSWYHLTMMASLVAFLVGALLIQYARMRRIGGLIKRLTPASPGATPSPAPAASLPFAGAPATSPVPVAPTVLGALPNAPTRWSGTLRVAAIFQETFRVKTFRLEDPSGADTPFTFVPGHFLTFSAEIEGERVRRAYTIASSPTQRGYVEVTVQREELGLISRYLHDRVAVGSLLEVSGPSGVFTFTGGEADSIVLISGGVGITPMMSVTRYLIDRSYPGGIFFLYGARTTQDFIFREELEYLQKRHSNLHVAATMSRAEGTAWMGEEGPISKEFIARAVPEIARRRVHICGPPPMMVAVKAALAELGVPKEQIRTEAFGPAKGLVPATPVPATPVPATTVPAPAAGPPNLAAVALPTATAHVEFSTSGKTAPLQPDQTVLEAAEAIGVAIDYSCRVGTCGICVVRLMAGTVTMEVEEGLLPEDKARGMILACQAKSIGNLVVEA